MIFWYFAGLIHGFPYISTMSSLVTHGSTAYNVVPKVAVLAMQISIDQTHLHCKPWHQYIMSASNALFFLSFSSTDITDPKTIQSPSLLLCFYNPRSLTLIYTSYSKLSHQRTTSSLRHHEVLHPRSFNVHPCRPCGTSPSKSPLPSLSTQHLPTATPLT